MKAILFVLTLFGAMMLVNSCQEEVVLAEDDIYHTWEVTDFISVESMATFKNENTPILLTFKRDGSYLLKLDVNSCTGSYAIPVKDSISLQGPGCTKMCCDSPFSEKLTEVLPRVRSYTIEKNTLFLEVSEWGLIQLELKE